MDNSYYAKVLGEVAALLQIKGANRFKVRAFQNASRAVRAAPEDVDALMDRGELDTLDGVGKSIKADLEAIRETGTCPAREDLLDKLDRGLLDVIKIQGLGPKKIKALYDELGITSLESMKEAAEAEKIRELDGFGAKTEEKILAEIERLADSVGRTPLPLALELAQDMKAKLEELDEVERIEIAGSIRRGKETIGDIDLLVASTTPEPIMKAAREAPQVASVIVSGDKKTSVRLNQGIQVDVRVVNPEVFGSALHYFTGSKEHHVKLRTRAKREGLKISEYGVFDNATGERLASSTEEELFSALGLEYIPPEIREGFGEIEAAEGSTMPRLLELSDVRGDTHMHTVASDGEATIEEMIAAAKARGYEYIVITDHSQSLTVANGLNEARLAEQIERIREVNATLDGFTVLSGIEVDILKDGALDMDLDLLRECDWVVGSVHLFQKMSAQEMTDRLLRAIDTGVLSSLGHPTGRILGGRGGYEYDMESILQACLDRRVAVEINGSEGRLDFNADHARRARKMGVSVVLSSDAHTTRGLGAMRFAVGQARRAWFEKGDVLNTLSAKELVGAVR